MGWFESVFLKKKDFSVIWLMIKKKFKKKQWKDVFILWPCAVKNFNLAVLQRIEKSLNC